MVEGGEVEVLGVSSETGQRIEGCGAKVSKEDHSLDDFLHARQRRQVCNLQNSDDVGTDKGIDDGEEAIEALFKQEIGHSIASESWLCKSTSSLNRGSDKVALELATASTGMDIFLSWFLDKWY
jgi:hypothetical protein